MAATRGILLSLLLAFVVPPRGMARMASAVGTSNPTIAIRVYDYAEVPKGTWTRAVGRASEIFHDAGVETTWIWSTGSRTEVHQKEFDADKAVATGLKLRILPRFFADGLKFTGTPTGYALVPADVGKASYAGVFYDRVELMAQEVGPWGEYNEILAEVLARVMAHELGHLLLGTNSHSPSGLMRANWTWQDLRPVDAVRLHFTPAQAAMIRSTALVLVKPAQSPNVEAATLGATPVPGVLPIKILPAGMPVFDSAFRSWW